MDRLEKLATPPTPDTVVVPDSVPPPGLVPIAAVMLAVEPVTVFPNASCTVACTAGPIDAPAVVLVGCTVKASREASAGLMLHGAEVSPSTALFRSVRV